MNRPMAVIGFSFFFTLIAVGLLGYIVAFWAFIVLAAVFLLAILICRRRLPTKLMVIMASVLVACAFFCTYTTLVYKRAVAYAGKELALTLEITDILGEENGAYHYTAKVVGSRHKGINGEKIKVSSSAAINADVCDLVSAKVTLGVAGASSRSSLLYYKSSGVFLKAHIPDAYEVEKNPDKSLGYYFYSIKRAVSDIVDANLSKDSAGVVNSVFLGDTSGLGYRDVTNFRNIGVSHIFCVSGLHVTLISSLIYSFLSSLIARRRILYCATILAVWFFVAVTGFSYSSIRSGIMLSIYYLGRMIGRDSNSLNSLGVAALVVCLLSPFSATNISFLYSFFATLGMIIMPRPRLRVRSPIVRSAVETAVMSLNVAALTLPIQIFYFGTATIISPLANCLIFFVAPALMACIIIAIILSLFTSVLSALFFSVSSALAKYLLFISDAVVNLPYTTVNASELFVKVFVVIAVAGAAALVYLNVRRRRIALVASAYGAVFLAAVLCYNLVFAPDMSATVIDSGVATSVVVTQGDCAVVVGCGGSNYTATEVACQLQQGSVKSLDLLVLPSRNKSDVINLSGLVEMVDVERIICGEEYGLPYSLGVDNFSVSREGRAVVGDMVVSYIYAETHLLTHIEMGEHSLLVISMISDGYEVDEKWRNADVVITVGEYYPTGNGQINVICTAQNLALPVTEVCYKGGGNIEIDFFGDGAITCERRA